MQLGHVLQLVVPERRFLHVAHHLNGHILDQAQLLNRLPEIFNKNIFIKLEA